jgi:hypothetical protein
MSGETAFARTIALNNRSEREHGSADGQPASGDLPVRNEPLRGLKTLAWVGALLITPAVLASTFWRTSSASRQRDSRGFRRRCNEFRSGGDGRKQRLPLAPKMSRSGLNFFYGKFQGLKDINLTSPNGA